MGNGAFKFVQKNILSEEELRQSAANVFSGLSSLSTYNFACIGSNSCQIEGDKL